MSFAFPSLLWALPAALAPLVIHLLARRRARRMPFPDLSFLRRVQARALPRTRLRQWLLVAARCLLLACLILAYAGPVLRARSGAASAAGGQGLDVVLLLDASYSMAARDAGRTRFELAKERGAALLRSLRPEDRAAVGVFSDRLEEPAGGLKWLDERSALAALERARQTARTTDFAPALRAAQDLLEREPRRRRAVVLLSDGARHGARGPLPQLDRTIVWLGLDWGAPPPNAYIASAGPAADSGPASPKLAVRAAGLGAAAAASIDVWVDGRRAQSASARGVQGEASAALPLAPAADASRPAWSGEARLKPDALALDDSFFFSFRHAARPKVLCLYGDPAFFRAPRGGYFLKELLGGARSSLLDYDVDFVPLDRLAQVGLSGYQAVVLAGEHDVPAASAAALERYVRSGGGLWVIPGASAQEGALASLSGWLPAALGPLVSAEGLGLAPGPASSAKQWAGFQLDRVGFARYYLLQVRSQAQVLFRSASGYPLLVSGAHGRGRATVAAFALDAGWTNLPLKPVFAPWVQAVLDGLTPASSRRSEVLQTVVGRPIERQWAPDEPAPGRVRLRAPDGRQTTLYVSNRRVASPPASEPGLYELTEEGSGRRDVYAVNVDRATGESDLAPWTGAPWKALKPEALVPDFRREVYGRDAREGFLGAALLLLLLELLLSLPGILAPREAAAQASKKGSALSRFAAIGLTLLFLQSISRAEPGPAAQQSTGDRFVWTQLELGPQWDPYPTAPGEILSMLGTMTSVLTAPQRRVVTLEDKALFFSPVVVLAGREAPPPLDDAQVSTLRAYLSGGGLLWIEDVSGSATSSFDRWVRATLPKVLPEAQLAPLPPDNVVYRTFFLLRGPAGRVMTAPSLEGESWGGRIAVLYSRDDLLGVWPRDALGQPLFPCVPGGERQRQLGKRLAINILMYGLTGNYKADAVHQPFLLQKLRSEAP